MVATGTRKQTRRPRKQAVAKTPQRRSRRKKPAYGRPVDGVERVLALDSSSVACGWSLFDDGQLVSHGCYRQLGADGHGEKLMRFRHWLLDVLNEWDPHLLIYEAPYQGRMKNTFGVLSKYVGVIESVHYEYYSREIDKSEAVPAHLVKRTIGAKKGTDHEANKKIVLALVNQRYGLKLKFKANDTTKKISQDDEADAIALNWAWHEINRPAGPVQEEG